MEKEPWINKENEIFLKTREIVNKYDLQTLIVLGCPEDEYDSEVIDILNRCSYIDEVPSVILELKAIFEYWSSCKFYDENLFDMAEELVKLFKEE